MQLVEHDPRECAEEVGRIGGREQQRNLLRRGEQDVGRIAALAEALEVGVSPVRVSIRIGRSISATGRSRLR
jgi:hypothetical protein